MGVHSTFGKAVEGAQALNFGVSGGRNCDDLCVLKWEGCYSIRNELRPDRRGLYVKLLRHQRMKPEVLVGAAISEVLGMIVIPWYRFSSAGSLPRPAKVRGNKVFQSQLRRLLTLVRERMLPLADDQRGIHIPVESARKARFYRALIGDLAVVRESCQSRRRFLTAQGPCSFVAGGETRIDRVEHAREIAKLRRETTGRKCVVCPAVLNSWAALRNPDMKHPLAKCGACTACALHNVDVVYPLH